VISCTVGFLGDDLASPTTTVSLNCSICSHVQLIFFKVIPLSVSCHVLSIRFHQWPAGCSANPANGHGDCPKRRASNHRLRRFSSLRYLPQAHPVSGSGHPTRAPGQKRLFQETCPASLTGGLPHLVTLQVRQYNLRFFPILVLVQVRDVLV